MIVVGSVPSSHVYVRHLQPVSTPTPGQTVVRPPDPTPRDATLPGQWWPPRLLEAEWLREHSHRFDVVHVHFGFESFTLDQLRRALDVMRSDATPFVLTVHDLHNPHFADPDAHLAALDVLIPAADAVITLTPGAATAIAQRWGVTARVMPHPHVVPLSRIRAATRRRSPDVVIGVHAKQLRANIDVLPVVRELVRVIEHLPSAVLRIDLDEQVTHTGSGWYAPDVVTQLTRVAERDDVRLRIHPRFTDAELWDYLDEIDVAVLPYRFGTHSGWAEACFDLGVNVVAPDCGHIAEQHPCHVYRVTPEGIDGLSLRRAVREACEARDARTPADAELRAQERDRVAADHLRLYRDVLEQAA